MQQHMTAQGKTFSCMQCMQRSPMRRLPRSASILLTRRTNQLCSSASLAKPSCKNKTFQQHVQAHNTFKTGHTLQPFSAAACAMGARHTACPLVLVISIERTGEWVLAALPAAYAAV